jgi:hypothetical protein
MKEIGFTTNHTNIFHLLKKTILQLSDMQPFVTC